MLIGGSVVTTLIVVNIAVHVATVLLPFGPRLREWGWLVGGDVLRGQIWRLFTVQYLHNSHYLMHLLFNMMSLHFLGRPLENLWSPRKFFTIYTMCGLAGSLFFTLLAARGVIDPRQPAVGASGSIFGLLGIVAVLFPTQVVYIHFLFPMRIRTVAYVFGAIALFTIIQRGDNYGGEACHLAGLAFGVWWAARGERWWYSTEWRIPNRLRRTTSRPSPRAVTLSPEKSASANLEIDRILRKVYEGGVHTLTEAEKNTLRDDTERRKRDDARFGRVDRL
jgi:membrane associated rhomboid family serine protease